MAKIFKVNHEGDQYHYSDGIWWRAKDNIRPPIALIRVLSTLLPSDAKEDLLVEINKTEDLMEKQRIEKHWHFLKSERRLYSGVIIAPNPRETRCWKCHLSLDDTFRVMCGVCGGLVCDCGACLCGHP